MAEDTQAVVHMARQRLRIRFMLTQLDSEAGPPVAVHIVAQPVSARERCPGVSATGKWWPTANVSRFDIYVAHSS
jgi:hypothetical protein